MNAKLQAIAHKAAQDLIASIMESEDKILAAWHTAEEDAQENETSPKFKLGFSITLDLEADAMESRLMYSTKRSVSITSTIPDQNQMELMEKEESV